MTASLSQFNAERPKREKRLFKRNRIRAKELAEQLRVLTALAKDWGLTAQLTLAPGDLPPSSVLLGLLHTNGAHTYAQTHTYIEYKQTAQNFFIIIGMCVHVCVCVHAWACACVCTAACLHGSEDHSVDFVVPFYLYM